MMNHRVNDAFAAFDTKFVPLPQSAASSKFRTLAGTLLT
jgi:hypothetical protein